jgi:hypothetical protein
MSVSYQELPGGGSTMDGMTPPAHAKPVPRRDHLWVLAVIAACALIKVSPSWVGIAAAAGFPRFGRVPTDWTLAVIMEAYWAYALYAWLAAASGIRSRRFAMWSAAGVFTLSLAGQSAARLVGVKAMTAFANGMPVIVLALIALLVHLRQLDREDAAAAERSEREAEQRATAEATAADERTVLSAQVDALTAELDTRHGSLVSELEAERSAHATAQRDLAEALTRAETLAKKLATRSAQASAQKSRKSKQESAQDEDLTLEFRALDELQKDPSLRKPRMGGELARRLGVSPATGRRLHGRLTAQDRSGESLSERSPGTEDERSGERS